MADPPTQPSHPPLSPSLHHRGLGHDHDHHDHDRDRDLGPQVHTLMQSLQETIIANKNRHPTSTPSQSNPSSPYRPYYGSYHPTPVQSRTTSPAHSVEDLLATAERADTGTPTLELVGSDGHRRPISSISYRDKPLDEQFELVEDREGFFDMTVFDVTSQDSSAEQSRFFIEDDSPITESESDRPSPSPRISRRSLHRTESEEDRLGPTNKNRRSRSRKIPTDLSLTTILSEPTLPAPAPTPTATQHRPTPSPLTQNERNDTQSLFEIQLQQPNTSASNTLTQTSEPNSSTPSAPPSFLTVLFSPLLAHLRKTLPSRVQHRLHKVVLAWFLTTLICLITPVQQWVGPVPYLSTTAIVFFHPARTLGAQLEATFMGMLGTVTGMLLSWAGLAASVAFNSQYLQSGNKGGRGILAAFLFFSIFVVTWIRGKYPRFFLFSVMSSILVTFAFTKSIDLTTFSVGSILDFARPLFVGAVLSLLVNLTLWRESASQGLGRALNESLTEIRALLDLTTSAFLLDPKRLNLPKSTIDDASSRMRLALAKVLSAYSEARYEVSYGYACPADFKEIKHYVSKLTQHLGSLALSLQNEKFLLEARRASMAAPGGLRALRKVNEETEEGKDEEEWENQHHEKEMTKKAAMMVESLRARRDEEEKKDSDEESPSRPGIARPKKSGRSTPHGRSTSSTQENSEGEEDGEEDMHQTTVRSFRSMLSLSRLFGTEDNTPTSRPRSGTSTPTWLPVEQHPIPPKPTKEIYYGDKELLIKYLAGVKDPLVELTTACEETLEAVRKELGEVLDVGADLIAGDANKEGKMEGEKGKEKQKEGERAEEKKKGWWARFWPLIRGQGKTVLNSTTTTTTTDTATAPPTPPHSTPTLPADRSQPLLRRPLPDYARQIATAVISFDLHEQAHLERLRCDPTFQAGLDLGPREELFLVFFFMFSLREVARELRNLAESLRMLKAKNGMVEEMTEEAEGEQRDQQSSQGQGASKMKENGRKKIFLPKINFRKWIRDSNHSTALDRGGNSAVRFDNDEDSTNDQPRYGDVDMTSTRSSSKNSQGHNSSQSLDPNSGEVARRPVIHRLTTPPTAKTSFFANLDPDTEAQAPPKPPLSIRIRYNLWRHLHRLSAYEIKFGLKMAVAITAVSSLAYYDVTMDQFALDRGQWATISILVVMNPTVGGSVNTGFARIVGTLAGALWGVAAWAINGSDPYVLAAMGLILAYPLWYIFLTSTYTKIGSVGIIAYAVITLSVYTNPDSPDSVFTLAWKRTLTIIIGVLVALVLNWTVWPFVARHQLRKHVGRNIYELGGLYSMIISTYVSAPGDCIGPSESEVKQLGKLEKKMQVYILKCNELLNLTRHEPRLKGPFPIKIWKEVISSLQNLLDRLGSLKSAAKFISPDIQSELTGALRVYRRDVSAAVILYFHILSGSLISKTPLPPYFPSARIARIRLINRIRQLSDVLPLTGKAGMEYGNLYWYAYMSCMEEIIEELENLSLLVKLITGEPTTLRHHANPAIARPNEEDEAASPLDERTAVYRDGRLRRSHVQWESDENMTRNGD